MLFPSNLHLTVSALAIGAQAWSPPAGGRPQWGPWQPTQGPPGQGPWQNGPPFEPWTKFPTQWAPWGNGPQEPSSTSVASAATSAAAVSTSVAGSSSAAISVTSGTSPRPLSSTFSAASHASSKTGTAPSASSSAGSSPYGVGRTVNTTSGQVSGHPANVASGVSEYLGIPFAQPPLGDLRFAPPLPYTGSGKLSGLYPGRICPQQSTSSFAGAGASSSANVSSVPAFLETLGGLDLERSEDCLTLNVWTKWSSSSTKKPIMVWIYGGGFATGNSNSTAYNGQFWADEEDVVFVNFNYRLGIFGFSGAPGLTQNVGLLDQRLAVEWVRDNAAAFGGDPDRITLFGESAGAASTDYYSYAWTEDPIIAGFITESGEVNSFGNKQADAQAQHWYDTATSVGCGNLSVSTADEVVACMRNATKVPSANLTAASVGSGALSVILAQFGPTIDNKTVFDNYTQRAIDGAYIQRPALIGSNIAEADLFILIFGLFGITEPQSGWDYITRTVFTCPSLSASYARYLHNVPVWRYRYFPSFPNIQVPTSINMAYHLSEVFPLFNSAPYVSGQPSTPVEIALGRYMRDAWAAFAHDPVNGLGGGKFNWPQFVPDANTTAGLVLLGKDNATTASFSIRGPYDGDCPLFYQGIAAP